MILLFDIGNTHTHVGVAGRRAVVKHGDFPTSTLFAGGAEKSIVKIAGKRTYEGAVLCSVVPRATPRVQQLVQGLWQIECAELNSSTLVGVGIDYPKPSTIGPDRLANAVAVYHHFGAPALVVDFGTAVTFDVVDKRGNYVGGIIAPGLSAMTDYLHEKTALLPKIRIREIKRLIGKSTEEAMLIGAVHGYRGLIRQLVIELKNEMSARRLPIVATGGYAKLMAAKLPEITAVEPLLTLEGLRLVAERLKAES